VCPFGLKSPPEPPFPWPVTGPRPRICSLIGGLGYCPRLYCFCPSHLAQGFSVLALVRCPIAAGRGGGFFGRCFPFSCLPTPHSPSSPDLTEAAFVAAFLILLRFNRDPPASALNASGKITPTACHTPMLSFLRYGSVLCFSTAFGHFHTSGTCAN